jgi:hypothetical protein
MTISGTNFHQLLDRPFVAVISSGLLFNSGIRHALSMTQRDPCYIIVQPAWNFVPHATSIVQTVRTTRNEHPNVHFIFMCSTQDETTIMCALGLQAFHIHKNAFIDDKIFRPDISIKKLYSAVHIANVEKFKRHHLAWSVPKIAVVTYGYKEKFDYDVLSGYKDLAYANFTQKDSGIELGPYLATEEVRDIICASNCGLILSAEEGANNASTEYMLCGVPVITTPSRGGREVLFDSRHVRIVEPDANQINLAVKQMQVRPINPFEIRESVMRKMKVHRRRLIEILNLISGKDLLIQANEEYWIPQFTNKLRSFVSTD